MGDAERTVPFRAVNCPGKPGYRPDWQRHHLLPLQLLASRPHRRLFEAIDPSHSLLADWRRNGLLLPGTEQAAMIARMPMHRGPHGRYSAMLAERVGLIERDWSVARRRDPARAAANARFRLQLVQRAAWRILAGPGRRPVLHRRDPMHAPVSFSDLDAAVEALWGAMAVSGGNQP